ncbi:MAG: hypothetical protein HC866_15730 [Leptolyngbyaceae cyanobacterium RU_5_1]|nr:hypothetical protein [Leptolyngbyaceae cyanobacterium RU_5_1]
MTQKSGFGAIQRVIRAPGDFLAGATYPFRALILLLRSPQLLRSAVIPILVNVGLGIALYCGLLLPGWEVINHWSSGLSGGVEQWVAGLPTWLNRVLGWLPTGATLVDDLLRWLLAIALLISLGLLLVQFGAILGAPWYGSLAEQVERYRMGQLPSTGQISFNRALRDIGRAIAFQLKKLLLLVGFGLPLLLLNFFPPLGNLIASIGGITLAATLVFLDFLDPPLERRRLPFRSKLGLVWRTLPASVTFGLICLWLVSIPLLNLVMVPICIIAGTLFCCDYALPKLTNEALTKTSEV